MSSSRLGDDDISGGDFECSAVIAAEQMRAPAHDRGRVERTRKTDGPSVDDDRPSLRDRGTVTAVAQPVSHPSFS